MEENNFENKEVETNNNIQPVENVTEQSTLENVTRSNSKNTNNKHKKKIILIIILLVIVLIACTVILVINNDNSKSSNEINSETKKSEYWISGNSLEAFDLYFLQLENGEKNKVYSPLSIKYALEMLEEGTDGESKAQISSVIGNYEAKKYTNSKNMSFANAIFINNTYKNSVKDSYINLLTEKYNAEASFDSFSSPNTVNSWVSNKTLGLINNLFDDISNQQLLLINALAIDMEWEEKFLLFPGGGVWTQYLHENFSWVDAMDVTSNKFKDVDQEVSGMSITASFNNYDIVNELGEDNIRKTVKNAFIKYLEEHPEENISDYVYDENIDGLSDDQLMEKYLDNYIEDINSNYKREDKTTDFSLYVDDNVKVFAKDLKEYDGTTLQYVGIMPVKEDLTSYVNNTTAEDINSIINNLKELKAENFTDGVVTKIKGFIPKFKFEYDLDLMNDLKKLGITNVFKEGKANLTNISSDTSLYINQATHKANIEFTQDGIKAAAATIMGGAGAGGGFDYIYEVPVEEIDLTFDKPYMFIIRDKNTGEVWFVGTVYNPLPYAEDMTVGS